MLKVRKLPLDPTCTLSKYLDSCQSNVDQGTWNVDQAWNNFTRTQNNWDHQQNKASTAKWKLSQKVFHEKCAYCERRAPLAGGDIDHYEPKHAHKDKMFKWDNFLWSCTACNRGNKKTKDDYNAQGIPLFLNPTSDADDPLCFIEIDLGFNGEKANLGKLYPLKTLPDPSDPRIRADYTITELGLNDGKLPKDRARTLRDFLTTIRDLFAPEKGPDYQAPEMLSIRESLLCLLDPSTPHQAAIRQILYCEPDFLQYFYDHETYPNLKEALLATLPELQPLLSQWALPPTCQEH